MAGPTGGSCSGVCAVRYGWFWPREIALCRVCSTESVHWPTHYIAGRFSWGLLKEVLRKKQLLPVPLSLNSRLNHKYKGYNNTVLFWITQTLADTVHGEHSLTVVNSLIELAIIPRKEENIIAILQLTFKHSDEVATMRIANQNWTAWRSVTDLAKFTTWIQTFEPSRKSPSGTYG